MRFTTYSKYIPELADAVNLQGLLDDLGDFLLQSGFAGGGLPFWDENESDRSMEALRQAILQALMDSGQLTPEMLKMLRGESTGDPARDQEVKEEMARLLDRIVQRLIEEGYLRESADAFGSSGRDRTWRRGGRRRAPGGVQSHR